MRYNLALIPENSEFFIELAKNFSLNAQHYLLGNNSLPHISVCQFICNEENQLKKIKNQFSHCIHKTFLIHFSALRVKPGMNGLTFIELEIKINPTLTNFHQENVNFLKKLHIFCENPFEVNYQPHLTLAAVNSQASFQAPSLPISLWNSDFTCKPVLGASDSYWQFTHPLS